MASGAANAQEPNSDSASESRTAEAPAESDRPRVTLPEALETPVQYPEDAEGTALVVLELTIDKEGSVVGARTLSGEEPFAEVARSAALGWRFVPAKRADSPVPARIRFTVRFTPPPDPVTPPPSEEPDAGEPTPKRMVPANVARTAPLEIVVTGKRKPPGSVEVTREEARELPGSFGDPLRALEAQPGVVPIVSALPAFFIRGAPPSNVGFFLDGVDLPLLYHAFLGPSVVHPRLVGSVDFYPGSAPVRYGRFAGPVVAVNSSAHEGRFSGEGTLRVIDVGGFVESPFGACGELGSGCAGSARVAGRYSYTGLVLSTLSDSKLDYWDYLGQIEYALGPSDRIGVLAFGGYDYFRAPQESENNGGELTFHRVDARWDHRWDSASSLRVAVTGGFDRAAGAVEDSSVVTDESLRARVELEHRASDAFTIQAGLDARGDRYGLGTNPRYLSYPDYSTLFPERDDIVIGGYVGAEINAASGIRVTPGVRADVYRSQGTTAIGVDPRVAAEIYVSPSVRFEHSLGMAHQRPNFAAQVPGAQVADLDGGLQWALLWSSGIRMDLSSEVEASAAVFRTAYFNALDPIGGGRDFTIDRTVLERRATVSAAGLELRLQRKMTGDLGGYVSYTLSRSEQSTGYHESLSGFDRPHVLQGALTYALGRGFRVGARAMFYSGIPELNLEGTPNFTGRRRGAPYFRMDVRGAKRWLLGRHSYWEIVAEVLNATSTSEVVRLDCGERCQERRAGPVILPSIGVELGF